MEAWAMRPLAGRGVVGVTVTLTVAAVMITFGAWALTVDVTAAIGLHPAGVERSPAAQAAAAEGFRARVEEATEPLSPAERPITAAAEASRAAGGREELRRGAHLPAEPLRAKAAGAERAERRPQRGMIGAVSERLTEAAIETTPAEPAFAAALGVERPGAFGAMISLLRVEPAGVLRRRWGHHAVTATEAATISESTAAEAMSSARAVPAAGVVVPIVVAA